MEIYKTTLSVNLQLRIHPEMKEWLDKKANEKDVKVPDVVRTLIKNAMDMEEAECTF